MSTAAAIKFWQTLADSEDLPMNIYYYEEGYPVIVIKWAGSNSSLSSIMLNSHMDVVPAEDVRIYYPSLYYITLCLELIRRGNPRHKHPS